MKFSHKNFHSRPNESSGSTTAQLRTDRELEDYACSAKTGVAEHTRVGITN